eukprot:3460226-Rhodomonas_salina.1
MELTAPLIQRKISDLSNRFRRVCMQLCTEVSWDPTHPPPAEAIRGSLTTLSRPDGQGGSSTQTQHSPDSADPTLCDQCPSVNTEGRTVDQVQLPPPPTLQGQAVVEVGSHSLH